MTWRALVQPDFAFDGIAVTLGRLTGHDEIRLVPPATDLLKLVDADRHAVAPPSLRLPDDLGRVLYEALAAHYGAGPATQTQRQDYLHERGRVDRLVDTLAAIATRPVAGLGAVPQFFHTGDGG